jgi:NADH-quinone oxidoreductase subunit F
MEKLLLRLEEGRGKKSDIDLLLNVARHIEGNTICPLGDAAAWPVASAIRHFREEFENHINNPAIHTAGLSGEVTNSITAEQPNA